MKSKILRILGVVTTVAIIASALVAPVAAVTTPSLVLTPTTISATAVDTVTFNLNTGLLATDTITVAYPAGFVVTGATATITTGPGLGTNPIATVAIAPVIAGQVLTFTPPAAIGAGAIVQLVISNVVNPAAIGDYSVTVKTSKETTAVASNAVTTTAPVIPPLPGIVTGKNSAGIVLVTNSSITAINTVIHTAGVTSVIVGPGSYDEDVVLDVATVTSLSSSDGAATTIIKDVNADALAGGAITVSVTGVTIDGLTVVGRAGKPAVEFILPLAASVGTIKNCAITAGTGKGISVSALNAGTVTMTANTVTAGSNVGIDVAGGKATIGGTVTVGIGTGITSSATTTLAGVTITAATAGAGNGIAVTGGTATIGTTTLKSLDNALAISGGTVVFNGNTVDACGDAVALISSINITAATAVNMFNNKITNSAYYAVSVASGAVPVAFMYNTLTTNAKGINNVAAVAPNIIATNNWWGAAAGAAAGLNSAGVDATFPLGAAPSSATVAMAATVTDGVVTATGTSTILTGAAAFAANPTAAAISAAYTVGGYFDVHATGGVATDTMTITIAGTTAAPITAANSVMVWNAAFGRWDPLTTTALNAFGNYITVTGAQSQFTGTPIALVALKPVVPAAVPAVVPPYAPITGTTGFPVDGTFSWAPVAGATGYDVVVAEDSTLADKFAVINYSASTTINASPIPADQTLKYDTVYWWRVRATNAVGPGPWTVGFFTTEKAPPAEVTPTATATVTTTIPVVTSVPVPNITLNVPTQEPVNVIPPFLLWAVVAVGVILIIAVIVLIVRTRRIS